MSHDLPQLSESTQTALSAERARPPVEAAGLDGLASRIEATWATEVATLGQVEAAPTATQGPAVSGLGASTKLAFLVGGLLTGGLAGAWLHARFVPPTEIIIERRIEVPVRVEAPAPIDVSPLAQPARPSSVPSRGDERPATRPRVEPSNLLPSPTSTAPQPAPQVAAPVPVAPPARSALEQERLLAERAVSALSRGKALEALTACDEHERLFPQGQHREELESQAIRALMQLGRRDEAAERARRFQSLFPESLLLDAVEASLK
ncbi:MAG: hypothetical protein IAE78_06130 [Myxococcus sp.]|nr:hypothetical protein [Myxococcus sp.]